MPVSKQEREQFEDLNVVFGELRANVTIGIIPGLVKGIDLLCAEYTIDRSEATARLKAAVSSLREDTGFRERFLDFFGYAGSSSVAHQRALDALQVPSFDLEELVRDVE